MKGYLVLHFNTTDVEGFQKYKETASPILKRYISEGKAKLIINAPVKPNLLEDRGSSHDTLQVIEFSSPNVAKEFYNLTDYQETIKYRTSSTDRWTAILEGFTPPDN